MAHTPSDPRIAIDHSSPTRVLFGPNSVECLGDVVGEYGERVLIVTDAGLAEAGHLEHARASLTNDGVAVYDRVTPNPTTDDVTACAEFARGTFDGHGPDVIVGLGGGSSMDSAKGTLFLLAGGGTMHDYRGVGRGRGKFLPLITVPTTSGTGSEAQSFAVISDAKTHLKMACGDKRAAAKVAILDPMLTLTMPAAVTAVTGIDAISHAIETYVTSARTTWSQMYSQQSYRLLERAFDRVLADPNDLDARGDMLLGAHFAGKAIEASMLGATHAMANPLTARFGMIHGVAIATLLPTVIEHNSQDATIAALYGELSGMTGGGALVERIHGWIDRAGLTVNADVRHDMSTAIPEMAVEATDQMTGRFNPRPMIEADFAMLYEEALS